MLPEWSGGAAAAIAIVVATAVSMEGIALIAHRYWMHGPGWGWHRSHHEPAKERRFERNDRFGAIFAALAISLTVVGDGVLWPLYWVGIGMTVYGLLYAVVHDGIVHRRWPIRWKPRHRYLQRLIQAHRLHHALLGRSGGVSFGFLYAPPVARIIAQLRARRVQATDRALVMRRAKQSAVGVLLAMGLIGGWTLALFYGLFLHRWSSVGAWLSPLVVALICWLDVGLFIVAHDAMHGSLAPTLPRLNRLIGRVCLALYAGFALDRFKPGHFEHHRQPGTVNDPDFSVAGAGFWPWYGSFMRRYFGWHEAAGLAGVFALLVGVLRAPMGNVLVFWALPAALSSVQLFAFGTWLPHRAGAHPHFSDHHKARSNAYGWWASLVTCFHFGYHYEHHVRPDAPWWHLPAVRDGFAQSAGSQGAPINPPEA